MKTILQTITDKFTAVLTAMVPPGHPVDPLIRPAGDPKFGDYQSNAAMGLAKALKKSPRDVAQEIVGKLGLQDVCSKIEIAGPGFINLHLSPAYLADHLTALKDDARLGVATDQEKFLHVVDFSSPNLAKEMHVGHLRTTITGEVICRVIEFMGQPVERVNHVGDWGTQFGMLLQYIYEMQPDVLNAPDQFQVQDLEKFYKAAKARFDDDAAFADAARQKVVLLQSGDATAKRVWQAFVKESLRHCHDLYKILGVTLTDVGESFYNDRLAPTIAELQKKGLVTSDQGALCAFLDGFAGREGEPLPLIVQKSDGGYNYATTDLAAVKYRVLEKGARRAIYITDSRQAQHFAMVFALARKAGWVADAIRLEHIGYGMVLGADRKPFKTREGGTVRLKDLITEGVERAREMLTKDREGPLAERVRGYSAEQTESIAKAVGLAAIKYCDLSHNLGSDYVFSWDKMLAMDGNTGPYMLYAYARIASIGRKGGFDFAKLPADARLNLGHPTEIALALALSRFGDTVRAVAADLKPNVLTEYLYQLAKAFSQFYDKNLGVPILDAETPELKRSRLLLCALTARALKLGLHLLSIETVEEM